MKAAMGLRFDMEVHVLTLMYLGLMLSPLPTIQLIFSIHNFSGPVISSFIPPILSFIINATMGAQPCTNYEMAILIYFNARKVDHESCSRLLESRPLGVVAPPEIVAPFALHMRFVPSLIISKRSLGCGPKPPDGTWMPPIDGLSYWTYLIS